MFLKKFLLILGLLLFIFFQGCATFAPAPPPAISKRPTTHSRFFKLLDTEVKKAGVRDASSEPVTHFPYLRNNRFLTFLGKRLEHNYQKELWAKQMLQLNLDARKKEIQNLPDIAISRLADQLGLEPQRNAILDRMTYLASNLFKFDQGQINYYRSIQSAAPYPDEYSTALRVIGLYPVASLPVAFLTRKTRREFKIWYETPIDDLSIRGEVIAMAPPENRNFFGWNLSEILRSAKDGLGIPRLAEEVKKDLLLHFAPIFHQDVAAPYDWPGEVVWDGNRVSINTRKPTVYYYFSFAFFKGEPVLQINYVTWYLERKGPDTPWIERGHLDGLTVRFTLTPDGEPFMVDIMNNCGCYHFFVPSEKFVQRQILKPLQPDAFVPQWLPDLFPKKRLGIRINSGWHQVQRIRAGNVPSDAITYQLIPYTVLEMLPHEDGRTESIFNDKGIGKGSHRIEPLLLFSMGIPDIGSMRQRGRHAIELVGRAHFDDPDLFEQNFIPK